MKKTIKKTIRIILLTILFLGTVNIAGDVLVYLDIAEIFWGVCSVAGMIGLFFLPQLMNR